MVKMKNIENQDKPFLCPTTSITPWGRCENKKYITERARTLVFPVFLFEEEKN
jgi:hypothetical protein